MGRRTRAIQKKLKGVEALNEADTQQLLLPDPTDDIIPDEESEN